MQIFKKFLKGAHYSGRDLSHLDNWENLLREEASVQCSFLYVFYNEDIFHVDYSKHIFFVYKSHICTPDLCSLMFTYNLPVSMSKLKASFAFTKPIPLLLDVPLSVHCSITPTFLTQHETLNLPLTLSYLQFLHSKCFPHSFIHSFVHFTSIYELLLYFGNCAWC